MRTVLNGVGIGGGLAKQRLMTRSKSDELAIKSGFFPAATSRINALTLGASRPAADCSTTRRTESGYAAAYAAASAPPIDSPTTSTRPRFAAMRKSSIHFTYPAPSNAG